MTGKKPTATIARDFRGSRLYLVRVTRAPKGYRWTADKAKALHFQPREAALLAREASRDYGAACTVTDTDGSVFKPAIPAFDGCTIRHQHLPDCKQPTETNERARENWLAARRVRS